MSINVFKAVGYHGTNKIMSNIFLKNNGIDCTWKHGDDVFLGGGFYLWRDSYYRAYSWSDRHADESQNHAVVEVEIECLNDDMLNFTTTKSGNDNKELKFFKLYIKIIDALQNDNLIGLHFGRFIDYMITEGVDIKLVSVHDLSAQLKAFEIQDPDIQDNKTYFALGDIQMCVKCDSIIRNKREVTNEN